MNPRLQASQIRSRLTLLNTKSRAAKRTLLGELGTDSLSGDVRLPLGSLLLLVDNCLHVGRHQLLYALRAPSPLRKSVTQARLLLG